MGVALTGIRVSIAATVIVAAALFAGMASDPAAALQPLAAADHCKEGQAGVHGFVRQGEGSVDPADVCLSDDATVLVVATPARGWTFEGWKGDCNDTGGARCWVNAKPPAQYAVYAYFSRADSPPTAPGNVRVVDTAQTQIAIAWDASSDDGSVAGYDVFLNGDQVSEVKNTNYNFGGLVCGTVYKLSVRARDDTGNVSSIESVEGSTNACSPAVDRDPPSTPSGLTVTSSQATSVGISWAASTDNVGVTGYDVLVGGSHVATVVATTHAFDGLSCGTGYTFGVRARDAAGNVSGVAEIQVSTAPCTGDTTSPSVPSGLIVTPAQTSLTLGWAPATDNVGVATYDLFIDGAPAGSDPGTSHAFGGLACGTNYTLGVRARDAAGNVSATATAPGSTAACDSRGDVTPVIGDAGGPVGKDKLPPPSRSLVVSIGGSGTGTVRSTSLRALAASSGRAAALRIVCGTAGFSCFGSAAPGARVRLTAKPARGSRFSSWTGACAGAGPACVLALSSSQSVKAVFARKSGSALAVAVQRPRFRIRWSASLGRGSLLVTGRVNRPSVLRLQLRRPGGGPLITQITPVLAGRFRLAPKLAPGLLPRGALVLPGGFVVSLKGRSGRAALPLQLQTIVLPAPPEGVVRRAFASPAEEAPPLLRLAAGAREAWANFVFEAQPRVGRRLTVRWYAPDGRVLGSVGKANRARVTSFLRSEQGIPSGIWRAELRAGGTLVKVLGVRVG